ncbi:MAG: DUF4097 family beta strand repeat protein [Proteobacteria bacterium]|nr:DUF4097 family beta strand repeat protein [Pseudomonadota bacterium]
MNRWMVVLIMLMAAEIQAAGCKFERLLDQSLEVSGSQSLVIAAGAGDLQIVGVSGLDEVKISGRVCVSEAKWLDEARLETSSGDPAKINVVLPDVGSSWSLWSSKYAYMDLELEVPEDLAMQLRDSSGDIEIEDISDISIKDSSGDIKISRVSGSVEIEDSSGDIKVRGIQGDFTIISDSSGDIRGSDIKGNVLVVADSSGDIWFSDVGKDVVIERDSSGDIDVENVGGDFRVRQDGSGRIRSKDVAGEVVIPEHKKHGSY